MRTPVRLSVLLALAVFAITGSGEVNVGVGVGVGVNPNLLDLKLPTTKLGASSQAARIKSLLDNVKVGVAPRISSVR